MSCLIIKNSESIRSFYTCLFLLAIVVALVCEMIIMMKNDRCCMNMVICFGSVLAQIEINLFLKVTHIADLPFERVISSSAIRVKR